MENNLNKIQKDILEIINKSDNLFIQISEFDTETCISKYDLELDIKNYFTKLHDKI